MSNASVYPVFLGLEETFRHPDKSKTVVLPVPLERTPSYRQGTARGPAAILVASQHMELYDEELRSEPCKGETSPCRHSRTKGSRRSRTWRA